MAVDVTPFATSGPLLRVNICLTVSRSSGRASPDEQGDVDIFFVRAAFSWREAMVANVESWTPIRLSESVDSVRKYRLTVVRREDHVSVGQKTIRAQLVDDSPHHIVDCRKITQPCGIYLICVIQLVGRQPW